MDQGNTASRRICQSENQVARMSVLDIQQDLQFRHSKRLSDLDGYIQGPLFGHVPGISLGRVTQHPLKFKDRTQFTRIIDVHFGNVIEICLGGRQLGLVGGNDPRGTGGHQLGHNNEFHWEG